MDDTRTQKPNAPATSRGPGRPRKPPCDRDSSRAFRQWQAEQEKLGADKVPKGFRSPKGRQFNDYKTRYKRDTQGRDEALVRELTDPSSEWDSFNDLLWEVFGNKEKAEELKDDKDAVQKLHDRARRHWKLLRARPYFDEWLTAAVQNKMEQMRSLAGVKVLKGALSKSGAAAKTLLGIAAKMKAPEEPEFEFELTVPGGLGKLEMIDGKESSGG